MSSNGKKPKSFLKSLLKFGIILAILLIIWTVFAFIGRVNARDMIPDSAVLRISVSNPVHLIDAILTHEPLHEITALPALAQISSLIDMLNQNPLLKNSFVRLIARGDLEFALLQPTNEGDMTFFAAWDWGLFSPLLRFLSVFTNFINVPNLYYVQAAGHSRFEYRTDDMTLYIGNYINNLVITNNSRIYEARSKVENQSMQFSNLRTSSYHAVILFSGGFIDNLFSEQDPNIAAILGNINIDSTIEAGVSIEPRKFEFRLVSPLSSGQPSLNRFIEQRSSVPNLAELLPASSQYATILSAGTLEELYAAALLFSGNELEELLRLADSASRFLLRLTLDDLLFSWSGNEFAVFGLEGRPHPVYAIQVSDERRRQEVFNTAFRSIVLSEDFRLNLDGMRIPRMEVPGFLQSLLQGWDVNLPSPYYNVYRDYIFLSESAETLLAAIRAMQRNDVLPRTAEWRDIAGGRAAASAFSLYYSLDISTPFFLRSNTMLSSFLSLYRQGLVRMSFDRGFIDLSVSLIPGQGSGVMLVNGFPLDIGTILPTAVLSNQVFGTDSASHVFLSLGNTALSINLADFSIHELSNQGPHWVVSADGIDVMDIAAWVVSDRGRVTLVDAYMEPAQGFPILTGLRISSPPKAFDSRLYLCDEDGRVHVIDQHGNINVWETSFIAAIRSPPSFLTIPASGRNIPGATYAAVYPKSFFGEIWLLDENGRPLPNWPVPVSAGSDNFDINAGIGFGSPLLFAHNNRVHIAYISQAGELVIYDENASLLEPFPIVLNGVFYLQPVFDKEFLWLVSENGTLFQINLDGEALYQNIPRLSVMEEGFIFAFDYNNDGNHEIFITGEGNALHGYTNSFRSLEGFPLPVWGKPLFIESTNALNTARKAEVLGIGMDRRLYRWQFR